MALVQRRIALVQLFVALQVIQVGQREIAISEQTWAREYTINGGVLICTDTVFKASRLDLMDLRMIKVPLVNNYGFSRRILTGLGLKSVVYEKILTALCLLKAELFVGGAIDTILLLG
jgi:hypothetical protein